MSESVNTSMLSSGTIAISAARWSGIDVGFNPRLDVQRGVQVVERLTASPKLRRTPITLARYAISWPPGAGIDGDAELMELIFSRSFQSAMVWFGADRLLKEEHVHQLAPVFHLIP